MTTTDFMWTVPDLSASVKISPGRIRQLLKEGRFPNARKVGRDWTIPDGDVTAWQADRDRRFKDVSEGTR